MYPIIYFTRKGSTNGLKKIFIDICYYEKLSQRDILEAYNKQYDKAVQPAAFNRSISRNVMKFNQLQDVLNSIGYTIEIKKK